MAVWGSGHSEESCQQVVVRLKAKEATITHTCEGFDMLEQAI